MTYEVTIRIHTQDALTDDQQRAWGDVMDDAARLVERDLADAGCFVTVEAHGPEALVA